MACTESRMKIEDGDLDQEFKKLARNGESVLTTTTKFVKFAGFVDHNSHRSCVHLVLTNPTNSTIVFNIRTPSSDCFFAKPRVGKVDPNKTTTIFFTFVGKCHRLPHNYCWLYSIYQLKVSDENVKWLKEDEFSTQGIRAIWKSYGKKEVKNIMYLAVLFDEGPRENDCVRHCADGILVNDEGEVLNVGNGEEGGGTGDEIENNNENENDDEMPPTAQD